MQKSEVVGRIMELLKGFDKVCCQKNYKITRKTNTRFADQRSRQSSYNHNPSKPSFAKQHAADGELALFE